MNKKGLMDLFVILRFECSTLILVCTILYFTFMTGSFRTIGTWFVATTQIRRWSYSIWRGSSIVDIALTGFVAFIRHFGTTVTSGQCIFGLVRCWLLLFNHHGIIAWAWCCRGGIVSTVVWGEPRRLQWYGFGQLEI